MGLKMTQEAFVVGIDVSKDMLDVAILPTGESLRLPNTGKGWGKLIRRLMGKAVAVVAFEATGGYERGLLKAVHAAHLPAARINPRCVRDFAKACGALAKNDRLDALMIARFAASLPPRLTEPDPAVDALAELVCARRQLSEEVTRTANQAEHAISAVVRRIGKRRIRTLQAEMKLIELEIAKTIAADTCFADKDRLLRTAPGVGAVTSATLLALLPELGSLTNRGAACLVGVAPFDHDSGKLKGQRCIRGGRRPVRDVLYMAALGAIRTRNSIFRACYERLTALGKKPKVAIVAVMRKLITTLNAMLRDNHLWTPT
jgi:transposase